MDNPDGVWAANIDVLDGLLAQSPRPIVLLVDCDICGPDMPGARIAVFAEGVEETENLVAHRSEIAQKQLMQCTDSALEKVHNVPAHRSSVKLPCLHPGCDPLVICTWVCNRCLEEIEFGSRDGFFYCDCGRVRYDRVTFN